MSEKKHQHYVPRGYLNRFRDEAHKFHIWNLELASKRYTDNITATFSHPYFYDHPDVDRVLGSRQAVENFLGRIESETLLGLRRFLDAVMGQTVPSRSDWELVLYFTAVQLQRTPLFRKVLAEIQNNLTNAIVREAVARQFGPRTPVPKVSHDEEHEHLRTLLDVEKHKKFVRSLNRLNCIVLQNDTQRLFITSDSPVSAVPNADTGRAAFLGDDAWFYFPLSPRVCLQFWSPNLVSTLPQGVTRLRVKDERFVHHVNQVVVLNADTEALCANGEFFGAIDLSDTDALKNRGVEVVTTHLTAPDSARSFFVCELLFKNLKHLSKFSGAHLEIGESLDV